MAKPFQNFRRPVVYILDQELRKRNLKDKIKLDTPENSTELSLYPIELIRDSNNKISKCLHGISTNQWSEEFIRANGKVVQIITTYPDGTSNTLQIIRDPQVHYIEEL